MASKAMLCDIRYAKSTSDNGQNTQTDTHMEHTQWMMLVSDINLL